MRIWNVARSQAQIQANMDNAIAPQAGLVAYYKLDHGVAGGTNTGLTAAIDSSGNIRNGALNTFALMGTTSNWVYGNLPRGLHTVTFNANGGVGSNTTQTASAAANLNSNTFTRTGYTFTGWNTQPGGGGTPYTDGQSYNFADDLVLYAQWTPNQYTVTFDGNGGGTASSTSKTVTYASTYGTLATVSRTGYTFTGWYTAQTDGSLVTAATSVSTAAPHTLYARWSVNSYTVSFDAQGGSPTPGNQSVAYGSLVTNPGSPTRTNYTFNGWYTAASSGSQWSSPATRWAQAT